MRIKKSFLATALGFSLVVGFVQVPTAGAVVEWGLTEDAVSLGLTGVSPHVERTGNADRLWYPGGLAGTAVADCNDAGSCTSVSITGRLGTDFTAITLPNGTRRAYFVEISMTPGANTKSVSSAPCLTAACTGVGTSTVAAAELVVSQNEKRGVYPMPCSHPMAKCDSMLSNHRH